jgi:HEAT repeats
MNLDESKGQKAEGRGQKKNKLRFILPSALIPLPLFAILLSCGCTQMDHFGTVVRREYNIITGKSPLNAARQMEDQYFPDERRVGIDRLSDEDFGRRPPYTKRYEQIAQYDSDWLVRATAIRALNRSRDVDATPIFIKALSDDNDLVRTEAAKALSNIPDDNAVPSLLKLVGDPNENRDARIWSAAALRH